MNRQDGGVCKVRVRVRVSVGVKVKVRVAFSSSYPGKAPQGEGIQALSWSSARSFSS